MGDPFIVPVAFFAMFAVIFVGTPLAKALARRMEREGVSAKVPREVEERLERMEHAIDSIAVEVERISEGQRFTTKLLTERAKQGSALPPTGAA